ncbi:MAG: hypothetical protein NT062_13630 [Proteobacteria bacterium]|nr:hypothetical protein [Pseudomonadota bacterium]
MRCATCGTENTADSKFCGGCGAKTSAKPSSSVAPTQKISDDVRWADTRPASAPHPIAQAAAAARYNSQPPQMPAPGISGAQPVPMALAPRSGPVSSIVPSIVPSASPIAPYAPYGSPNPTGPVAPVAQAVAPIAPIAPIGAPIGANPRRPTPESSLDASITPPRRGRGLVVAVLVLDLGLAAAGGWLLMQGLGY